MLPGVYIEIVNGGLGGVQASLDGVAGLIFMNADTSVAGTADVFTAYSAADIEKEDITDDAVKAKCLRFYEEAGDGNELNVYVIDSDESSPASYTAALTAFFAAFDKRVPVIGIETIGETFTASMETAVTGLQTLMETQAARFKASVAVVAKNNWDELATDLRSYKSNRVAVSIAGDAGFKNADAATLIGRLAKVPVQRNAGRVKNGSVNTDINGISNGDKAELFESMWNTLDAAGFTFLRTYAGDVGFYFNNDHTCAPASDDFSSIARVRAIDKAVLLAYQVLVQEVNEEVKINSDGTMEAGYLSYIRGNVENTINTAMTANGEISGVSCTIDAKQNILSTNKLEVNIRIVPVAYAKEISVTIGFVNPLLG